MSKTRKVALMSFIALFILVVSFGLAPDFTTEGSSFSEQSAQELSDDSNLSINITSGKETIYQNESKVFNLRVLNPSTNDKRISGFMYVGHEIRDNSPNITVAGQSPNVRYQNTSSRYLEFDLAPGGKRVFPIHVHRDSEAGDHKLNATAIYFENRNLTRQSSVAYVDVKSVPCSLICEIQRIVSEVILWIENNWEWIVSLLSLLVATASLVAPNRVRRFVGLSEITANESPNE